MAENNSNNLPALPDDSINQLIAQALNNNVNVEVLERLLEMRNKLRAEYAKEQFFTAMTNLQYNCPIIVKTDPVTNDAGVVAYRFAPIDVIVKLTKELLRDNGFSYFFNAQFRDDRCYLDFTIHHIAGHEETRPYDMAKIKQTRMMSDAQVESGTMSMLMRRAYCGMFGIITGDADVDGRQQQVKIEPITEEQILTITQLIGQTRFNADQWLKTKYFTERNITEFNQMAANQADEYIAQLQNYIDKQKGN